MNDRDKPAGEPAPQKPIDSGGSSDSVKYPEKPIDYGHAPDEEDPPDHQWVGPESNPAAAGDDGSDAGWIGPESNPASGEPA